MNSSKYDEESKRSSFYTATHHVVPSVSEPSTSHDKVKNNERALWVLPYISTYSKSSGFFLSSLLTKLTHFTTRQRTHPCDEFPSDASLQSHHKSCVGPPWFGGKSARKIISGGVVLLHVVRYVDSRILKERKKPLLFRTQAMV